LAIGCITAVFEHELKVELSDRVIVTVPLQKISQLFEKTFQLSKSNQAATTLPMLYSPGQLLIVKILEQRVANAESTSKWQSLVGTIDPREVNESLLLTKMASGQVCLRI